MGKGLMWQAVGASVIGTSHILTKTVCQDANGFHIADRYIILTVADGLGSALNADKGSRFAVKAVLVYLHKSLSKNIPSTENSWADLMRESFQKTRVFLEKASKSLNKNTRDFGTTLIVTVLTDEWVVTGHIGDGAIVALFSDGVIKTVSQPHRGEYANETVPITAVNAMDYLRVSATNTGANAVALFTDGLQNMCINFATGTPHVPFFTPFFDGICQKMDIGDVSKGLAEFLGSERVCEMSDDDKTLLIAGVVVK
jgi:hypothetical protein